jgi:hypothetical protein
MPAIFCALLATEGLLMPAAVESRTDIRVLGTSGLEDYYAHLLRLDPVRSLPVSADGAIGAHCLRLLSVGAILVGAYVDGVMRAAAEIVPDRSARQAEAAITVEAGFEDREFGRMLAERIVDEARRYHLSMLHVVEQSTSRDIQVADQSYAANGYDASTT